MPGLSLRQVTSFRPAEGAETGTSVSSFRELAGFCIDGAFGGAGVNGSACDRAAARLLDHFFTLALEVPARSGGLAAADTSAHRVGLLPAGPLRKSNLVRTLVPGHHGAYAGIHLPGVDSRLDPLLASVRSAAIRGIFRRR